MLSSEVFQGNWPTCKQSSGNSASLQLGRRPIIQGKGSDRPQVQTEPRAGLRDTRTDRGQLDTNTADWDASPLLWFPLTDTDQAGHRVQKSQETD